MILNPNIVCLISFSANAVRLVPVKLSQANPTTSQANLRLPLSFRYRPLP
jgi:hypothetical protein